MELLEAYQGIKGSRDQGINQDRSREVSFDLMIPLFLICLNISLRKTPKMMHAKI